MKNKFPRISLWLILLFSIAGNPAGVSAALPPDIDGILKEVEQAVAHYRAWLDKPVYTNVIKGTNHAARAVVLIEVFLEELETAEPDEQRIGVTGIQKVLLKQMRIHTELLSTSVPIGIVEYDSDVETAVEEQLDLLERTLEEFKRVHRGN